MFSVLCTLVYSTHTHLQGQSSFPVDQDFVCSSLYFYTEQTVSSARLLLVRGSVGGDNTLTKDYVPC